METKMNEQQSLELISEMIAQAKTNFQKNAALSHIVVGYTVAAVALLNFVLLHTLDCSYQSFWVWLLMIPMSIITSVMDNKQMKKATAKSHIDRIISSTWSAFGFVIIILLTCLFLSAIVFKTGVVLNLITPIILLLTAFAQLVTAVACRFKPYYTSVLVFAFGAPLCILSLYLDNGSLQFIILAICFIIGFAIPGHILNRKAQ